MTKLLIPILLVLGYTLLVWKFSAWRLKRELDAKSEPLDDPKLEAVVRRLGRAVGVEHLKANVYRQPAFNGLAAPDGRIFITKGVLKEYARGKLGADEVGSIIAHELGHVALGHTRRRMIDWAGQNALRVGIGMIVGRFIPFVGVWIGELVASLVASKLSRDDEFAADAYAAALMRKAGVRPEAQLEMFRKLGGMAQPPGGFVWLMSHPPLEDRIAAVQALHASWDADGSAPQVKSAE